ncbi:DHH family phosphoesterase [archaeon]|nr:DHH family phosphoesterase [archaeon]
MILVTPYCDPDLDGTACAFAYTEFLQKTGRHAIAGIFGNVHKETEFVMKTFNINKITNAEKLIDNCKNIILVDASDISGISKKIKTKNVTEIIDHRKVNEAEKFPNAKIQIEFVGAAATLIAEKFYKNKLDVSKKSAALLFSAIVSNTINFKANVTTDRDVKMAKWLKKKSCIQKNYIRDMFLHKSKLSGSLKKYIIHDFAAFNFGSRSIGIAQMELIDVEKFLQAKNIQIGKILDKIKKENRLDIIFLTCIDVERCYNGFVAIDNNSKQILTESLKIRFNKNIAKRKGIIMRKEIVPLIKNHLEKK